MFSKIIRRSHMYLALFLTPWVLMYALSTLAMNHRGFFKKFYGTGPAPFKVERDQTYARHFSPDATPAAIAEQILKDLHLEGTYTVRGPAQAGRLTVFRQDPISPRRITFTPADGKLLVEKEVFRTPALLERLHRRRGFQHKYIPQDAWAFSVDLFIAALFFWAASGLWMWWELSETRRWGALATASGIALFTIFLLSI
jgi:hypothetical protein